MYMKIYITGCLCPGKQWWFIGKEIISKLDSLAHAKYFIICDMAWAFDIKTSFELRHQDCNIKFHCIYLFEHASNR